MLFRSSNPTYLVSSGERRWVLRKKPPGKLLPSAHQVDREFRVMQALKDTDAAVARLVEGLKARGLWGSANLVILADHGMAPTSAQRVVYLDDIAPAGSFRTLTGGPLSGSFPVAGREAEAYRLLGRHPHMPCWKKCQIPVRYHFGPHRRIPPIVCLAETGWLIRTHAEAKERPTKDGGAHGFDPYDPLMRALFIAHGPAFRSGVVVGGFDNVDVYPMLARLVGIVPLKNDGDRRTMTRLLRR